MLESQAPGVVGPFAGMDVPWLLKMRSQTRRDHPFLIWAPFDAPVRVWAYGEFHDRVGALAAGLVARGVRPGEFVLIHLDNCIEAMLAWFACVELGAIAVTTNTRSAPAEMEYFAGHCGAVAAITQPSYAETIAAHCKGLRWVAVISHDAGTPPAQGSAPQAADSFEALFADSTERPRRATDPLAPCSVQYTSGTTSRPKAVLWTHANALWGAKVAAAMGADVSSWPYWQVSARAQALNQSIFADITSVMDFGIVHQSQSTAGQTLTSASGTPAYMPPEQGFGSASPAADIYALAVMTYEMLTGSRPFTGTDLLGDKLAERFPAASQVKPSLPKGIDGLLTAALRADPAKRTAKGADFLRLLDQCALPLGSV